MFVFAEFRFSLAAAALLAEVCAGLATPQLPVDTWHGNSAKLTACTVSHSQLDVVLAPFLTIPKRITTDRFWISCSSWVDRVTFIHLRLVQIFPHLELDQRKTTRLEMDLVSSAKVNPGFFPVEISSKCLRLS